MRKCSVRASELTGESREESMAASRIELVTDASAWRAEDYPRREQWTRRLTLGMLADLDRAIRGAIDRGVDYGTITAEDFPIPACTALLDEVRAELDTGRGFAVVGGRSEEHTSELQSLMRISY